MPFLPGSKLPQLLQTEQTFKSKATIYTHAGKECDRKENSPQKFLNLSKNSKGQRRHGFPFFKPVPGGAGWHGIKASLTLEAAIALPVMIFTLYLLMFPIKVMNAERRLQNSMEAAAEKLSLAEYIKTVGEGLINMDSEYMDTVDGVVSGVEQGAAAAYVLASCDNRYLKGAMLSPETAILSEEEGEDPAMITIEVLYRPDMPVRLFDLIPAEKSLVVNKRAWVGSEGGRGRDKYSENAGEDGDEEFDRDRTVYLGKTSSEVYHMDPNCHYLSNRLKSIDAADIDSIRNAGGGKYHACSSCKPDGKGTVYYMENGTAYHGDMNCKAITAYVHTEKLGDCMDRGMRPCSYCGK